MPAAMSPLALWFVEGLHDAQRARNQLFPAATESPIVFFTAISMCTLAHQFLEFPMNPVRDGVPSLVALFATFTPLIAEALSPVATGHYDFLAGTDHPSAVQIQNAVEQLRHDMEALGPGLLRWRLSLNPRLGQHFDRLLTGFLMCCHELAYFDCFPVIEVISYKLFRWQSDLQAALEERAQASADGSQ